MPSPTWLTVLLSMLELCIQSLLLYTFPPPLPEYHTGLWLERTVRRRTAATKSPRPFLTFEARIEKWFFFESFFELRKLLEWTKPINIRLFTDATKLGLLTVLSGSLKLVLAFLGPAKRTATGRCSLNFSLPMMELHGR